MKLKHLIIVRFLVKPFGKIDVLSQLVIDNRLNFLIKNLIPSLNNQCNVDFELILMTNPLFDKETLEKIDQSIKICNNRFKYSIIPYGNEVQVKLKNEWNNNDYVVLTRIDDDDFINKFAVQDVRDLIQINENIPILVSGYKYGYKYVFGENTIQNFVSEHNLGHIAIFQSFIYRTKDVPFSTSLNPYNFPHTNVVDSLNKLGYSFKIVHFDRQEGFIYFRHPFANSYSINKQSQKFIPNNQLEKEHLKDMFGFRIH